MVWRCLPLSDGCGVWDMRRLHGAEEVQKHQIEKFNVRCMRHIYGVGVSVPADI
jgi:hypothetical protein